MFPALGATSLTQLATNRSCGDYSTTAGNELIITAHAQSPFNVPAGIGLCGARDVICVQTTL